MKFLMEGFKELNYKELLAVNGGCSGYCSGGYTSISRPAPVVQTPSSNNTTSISYSGQCSTYVSTGNSINEAIKKNMDKTTNPYVSGKNDCDIWTEKVLKEAGFDISKVWGSTSLTVADHEKMLAGKTTDKASTGWSVVLMTESDKYSQDHCGIINVARDGSVAFYQNTKSAGGPVLEKYSSVSTFQKAYAYKDFDYFKVAN